MFIRSVQYSDASAWERLRYALWPATSGEHAKEIAAFFANRRGAESETLLALDEENNLLGFAELSIRNYAEGCETDRVAYLEGWYVAPHARRNGVGTALIKAAEEWGRAQGCNEFASDTEWHNEISAAAHRALGFVETDRIICFKKNL